MAAADELAGSSPVAGSKDEADADGSRRPERSGLKGRRRQGVGVSCTRVWVARPPPRTTVVYGNKAAFSTLRSPLWPVDWNLDSKSRAEP